MNLQLSERAIEKLNGHLAGKPGIFRLFYDVEDCGCNGVLVIQLLSEPYRTDLPVQAEPFTFYVDARQEAQFDETMRLEADLQYPSFKLSSDSGVFGSNIKLKDIRK